VCILFENKILCADQMMSSFYLLVVGLNESSEKLLLGHGVLEESCFADSVVEASVDAEVTSHPFLFVHYLLVACPQVLVLPDVDSGLEWCEQRLIESCPGSQQMGS
jgi:hypothetical protein